MRTGCTNTEGRAGRGHAVTRWSSLVLAALLLGTLVAVGPGAPAGAARAGRVAGAGGAGPAGAPDPATPGLGDALGPSSVLVPCSQAAVRTTVTADAHLDPTCTYTAGFDLVASATTLDCQGATVAGTASVPGIVISAPTTLALQGVHVRNCRVAGFMNGIKVTRPGFLTLAEGVEYENGFRDISIEDSTVTGAAGVGIYVDGYVTGVTIRHSTLVGNGSTGVYLDTGSKDNTVADNDIRENGFAENGPGGTLTTIGGLTVRYWGPGREGLAVDGSRSNHIVGNRFAGNAAGSIFLYKNCGEYHLTQAASWLPRRYGSNDNVIEGNSFTGGLHGVWVGARMGENTYPMECSAPAYIDAPLERYVEDEATDNVVRANTFTDVTYGVHVEDDRTTVEANTFTGNHAGLYGVIAGTRQRTAALHHPVTGTVVRANTSSIAGNPNPYRWVDGEAATTTEANTALGASVDLCEAPTVPHNVMVMVIAFAVETPGGPVSPTPDLTVPTLGPLPACPAAVTPPTATQAPLTAGPATAVVAPPAFTG